MKTRVMTRATRRALAFLVAAAAIFAAIRAPHPIRAQEQAPKYAPSYPDAQTIDVCAKEPVAVRSLLVLDFADPQTTLDGWQARDGVELQRGEKTLKIISKTEDPYFFSPMTRDLLSKAGVNPEEARGAMLVKFVARRENEGGGQLFFAQTASPGYDEGHSTHFKLEKDADFHEYQAEIVADSPLLRLRFDIGGSEGLAEIARIELFKVVCKPAKFGVASLDNGKLLFNFDNLESAPITVDLQYFGFDPRKTYPTSVCEIEPGKPALVDRYYAQKRPFEEMEIVATARNDAKDVATRRYFAFNEDAADAANDDDDALVIQNDRVKVKFASDASGAEFFLDGKRVAVAAPLLCEEGDGADVIPHPIDYDALFHPKETAKSNDAKRARITPAFRSISKDGREIVFDLVEVPLERARQTLRDVAAKSVEFAPFKTDEERAQDDKNNAPTPPDPGAVVGSLEFRLDGNLVLFDCDAPRPVHAPVLRALGAMRQAVFPGVEYLEEGEHSSSTADIETKEAVRYAPSIYWATQPYAAIVTERGSLVVLCDDPKAQPIFAVPDFIDGDDSSSRINYCAKSLSGKIRLAAPEPIENAIFWAVKTLGLPDPPTPPRTGKELEKQILYGLQESALKTPQGWVHALLNAKPPYTFKPNYGCDFISTIWELTGDIPATPRVDFGGAHINNYNSLLLTGHGNMLVGYFADRRGNLIKTQRDDGSWGYYGKFLKGSRFDYASGDCGNKLFALMEDWRLTGNEEALAAAEKGLAFVNKLRTPAGAQVWELSLHTPDIMGASRCVLANVFAYEATGKNEYLAAARRWALAGVPFVYLWEDPELNDGKQPLMKYATIAVFGATGWQSPNWMGRPVQWCGLDYAYALIHLSHYDDALDWLKIADGIVASAECQLYQEDEPLFYGLLPDSVQVDTQERYAFNINPTVVHMLRRMIDEKPTNVSVVDVVGKRVVSPYPAVVDGNVVKIQAKKGVSYQIMIDGKELREIKSVGLDEIAF